MKLLVLFLFARARAHFCACECLRRTAVCFHVSLLVLFLCGSLKRHTQKNRQFSTLRFANCSFCFVSASILLVFAWTSQIVCSMMYAILSRRIFPRSSKFVFAGVRDELCITGACSCVWQCSILYFAVWYGNITIECCVHFNYWASESPSSWALLSCSRVHDTRFHQCNDCITFAIVKYRHDTTTAAITFPCETCANERDGLWATAKQQRPGLPRN